MANLKVAVRIRPMSNREIETGAVSALSIENGTISVTNIKVPEHHAGDSRERIRKFYFDYCFHDSSTQDEIFSMIGNEISTALSNRYHACVLAYGQSSTGKTYTMMGTQDDPGLTPRLCENIFSYFQSSTEEEIKSMHICVSYLEIYNERVLDLLVPSNSGKSLKVREHPKKGPYVQGLSEHRVFSPSDLISHLSTGNGNRRIAATSNNRRSSRSHCVFTITSWGRPGGSACRLHLVDLAGSERAGHATSGGTGVHRLKEGANINRSLVALGNVICALSDPSSKTNKSANRKRFVPYRDSVLTWLLKETLGGNSKTVMIATISPSSTCYNETVNTLRFGQRAQQIVNQPLANEDSQEKLIRELRKEIARLKELLNCQNLHATIHPRRVEEPDMTDSTTPKPPGELQTLKLLPVELITSEDPPKLIEFTPKVVIPPRSPIQSSVTEQDTDSENEEITEEHEDSITNLEEISRKESFKDLPKFISVDPTEFSKPKTKKQPEISEDHIDTLHLITGLLKVIPSASKELVKQVLTSFLPVGSSQTENLVKLLGHFVCHKENERTELGKTENTVGEEIIQAIKDVNDIDQTEEIDESFKDNSSLKDEAISEDILLKEDYIVDEIVKKILPTLLQNLSEPSNSHQTDLKDSPDDIPTPSTSPVLREKTFIIKPRNNPEINASVLVDHLIKEVLPEDQNSSPELDQIKKDTVILVNKLLAKVDRLSEKESSPEDLEQEETQSEEETKEDVKQDCEKKLIIEEIKEISVESSPVKNKEEITKDLKKEDAKTEEVSSQKQDTLIPVIDITSSVKPKHPKVNQLNRTGSVEYPKTSLKKLKDFGSHETLSTPKRPLFNKSGKLSGVNRSFIKPDSTNPSRSGSISESSGVSTPKRGFGVTRRPTHKRSEIVAAVTQRLYNKRKEKQEEEKLSALEAGKMFNAKIRLQDITQRALRASKRRVHVEVQTEEQSTIRMKEKSTDVQDIAKVNNVVKDQEVEALTETQNIGISCQIQSSNQSLKLTGTSSTQTEEQKPNQTVSFTKYLQNPPLRLPYSQPIYTSSVNINVQHNYKTAKEEHSDDSLEENLQAVQFSTPDLISNHNSLEQVNIPPKENKAVEVNNEKFVLNECFATKKCEYCVADTSFVPPTVKQKLTNISIPASHAPENCVDFTESCKPLRLESHEVCHPCTTFEGCEQVKTTKPALNHCPLKCREYSSDEESDCCKKVRFSKRKDILDVVTNFLDEASNLLFKLNTVAKQVEVNKERQHRFIFPRIRRERKECFVQTSSSLHDASCQTCKDEDDSCVQTEEIEEQQEEKDKNDSDSDYPNVQTTSTDWKFCSGEYSSLDTMRSTSDYGSLPRGKHSRKNHYSPKAYMQQLIAMRKKIVEDSRKDDILAAEYMRLPSPELF